MQTICATKISIVLRTMSEQKPPDMTKAAGMCPHSNFPDSCQACRGEQKRDPKELLLTPEEERAESERRGPPPYLISARAGDREITVVGTKHTNNLAEVAEMVSVFEESDPDVVIVEGQPLEKLFPGKSIEEIRAMKPEEVIDKEEQAYMAWLALQTGKELQYWDLSTAEQIRRVLELKDEKTGQQKYNSGQIAEWIVTYGIWKIYERGDQPSHEKLQEVVQIGMPGIEELDIDLSYENVDAILRKYGSSMQDDQEHFKEIAFNSSMHAVVRDMIIIRDRHAIEVLADAKKKYKKVFATAGGGHTLTWEPALKNIYQVENK